jgi:class 3 adenylate cyclase
MTKALLNTILVRVKHAAQGIAAWLREFAAALVLIDAGPREIHPPHSPRCGQGIDRVEFAAKGIAGSMSRARGAWHFGGRMLGGVGALGMVLTCLLGADNALAQSGAATPSVPGTVVHQSALAPPLIYLDWLSHALVGVVAALAGVFAHRAWLRRRWRRAPAGVVIEAVLAVDLVNSTWLATHHGEDLAMRARNALERRALAAANPHGLTFTESTGDGRMMTFPSVPAAARAASELLRELRDRPPETAPSPPLEVRAAIAYGQILLDSRGGRHGAAINEAFRLMSVPSEAFVTVEGEERLKEIPDRNRIFLDEDAAHELGSADVAIRQVGVCRLKGFSGFHRVYELQWNGV